MRRSFADYLDKQKAKSRGRVAARSTANSLSLCLIGDRYDVERIGVQPSAGVAHLRLHTRHPNRRAGSKGVEDEN